MCYFCNFENSRVFYLKIRMSQTHIETSNQTRSINAAIHLMFCDIANHGTGMQQFGTLCDSGFTNEHLLWMHSNINSDKSQIYNVTSILPKTLYEMPDSYILVLKGFFNDQANHFWQTLLTSESSDGNSLTGVNWDVNRINKGKLVFNKLGYKLLFYDLGSSWKFPFSSQDNRGTIYNLKKIPTLDVFQEMLQQQVGFLPVVDGTYFYDLNECFIPLHQVKDRKKIVGLGIGATMPLQFRWFHGSKSCSETMSIPIENGDLYIISEGAAGIRKEKQTKLYLKYGIGNHPNLFD